MVKAYILQTFMYHRVNVGIAAVAPITADRRKTLYNFIFHSIIVIIVRNCIAKGIKRDFYEYTRLLSSAVIPSFVYR